MTVAELTALRTAFGELMGAERRLRGRDPRHAQIRTPGALIAKDEQITAGSLAKRAELSPGAMTAMLDQLEEDGVIVRRRSETDRRQVIVALTEAGHEAVAAKRAVWEQPLGRRAWPRTPRRSSQAAAARHAHDRRRPGPGGGIPT